MYKDLPVFTDVKKILGSFPLGSQVSLLLTYLSFVCGNSYNHRVTIV